MFEQNAVPPSAWAQAYVGLPYIAGAGECAQRAALVWRQEFGIEVEVTPAFGDLRAAQRHIREELAKPDWTQVRHVAEGDAVLMLKGDLLCHVGVWVNPGHVLHCTRADGMVLTPVDELSKQGFRIFGYFRRQSAELALAA